jgi:L-fuconolactonase
MIRVDAHHHVWRVARGDYGWLTPDLPIHRDYTLDDLRPLLGDITATVLIQAAPDRSRNRVHADVARDSRNLVRGVVGWTDLAAPMPPRACRGDGQIAVAERLAAHVAGYCRHRLDPAS